MAGRMGPENLESQHGHAVSHMMHPKAKSRSMMGIGSHPQSRRKCHSRNMMSIMAISFLI